MEKINIEGIDETIYKGICDNGLEVYIWPSEKVKTTYMTLSVKYGSLDTEFKVDGKQYNVSNGTAHFLEHIKFNQKDGTSAHEYFTKLGADTNAFTTFKYTSYLVYTIDNIKENLCHLLDFVFEPFFNNKMIQKEKGIIIEEAKMGKDSPGTLSYFGVNQALFQKSKYRNFVTGDVDDIKKISLNDIKIVYDSFYVPNNMFLCITGNVNPLEIFEIVKENQKDNQKSEHKVEKIKTSEPEEVNEVYKKIKSNLMSPMGTIALKIPKKKFKGYTDLDIKEYLSLALNINFGSTSEFKDELMSSKLVTGLGTNVSISDGYVIIKINFDSRFPDEIVKMIEDKLNNLELSKKDFTRKVNASVATCILAFEDVEIVNSTIQEQLINYDKIIYDYKTYLENLDYKILEDITKKINMDNKVTFIMVPNK